VHEYRSGTTSVEDNNIGDKSHHPTEENHCTQSLQNRQSNITPWQEQQDGVDTRIVKQDDEVPVKMTPESGKRKKSISNTCIDSREEWLAYTSPQKLLSDTSVKDITRTPQTSLPKLIIAQGAVVKTSVSPCSKDSGSVQKRMMQVKSAICNQQNGFLPDRFDVDLSGCKGRLPALKNRHTVSSKMTKGVRVLEEEIRVPMLSLSNSETEMESKCTFLPINEDVSKKELFNMYRNE